MDDPCAATIASLASHPRHYRSRSEVCANMAIFKAAVGFDDLTTTTQVEPSSDIDMPYKYPTHPCAICLIHALPMPYIRLCVSLRLPDALEHEAGATCFAGSAGMALAWRNDWKMAPGRCKLSSESNLPTICNGQMLAIFLAFAIMEGRYESRHDCRHV